MQPCSNKTLSTQTSPVAQVDDRPVFNKYGFAYWGKMSCSTSTPGLQRKGGALFNSVSFCFQSPLRNPWTHNTPTFPNTSIPALLSGNKVTPSHRFSGVVRVPVCSTHTLSPPLHSKSRKGKTRFAFPLEVGSVFSTGTETAKVLQTSSSPSSREAGKSAGRTTQRKTPSCRSIPVRLWR